MIRNRRGEITETCMTEGHGEMCESCLQAVRQENRRQFGQARPQGQDG